MRSAAVLNMGNIFSNFLISMSRYKSHLLSSEERSYSCNAYVWFSSLCRGDSSGARCLIDLSPKHVT